MTLWDDAEPDVRQVSLVRLSGLISRAAGEIGRVAVEGEVHKPNSSRTTSGRMWFTLRDRAAQVAVSVPGGRRARCRVVAGERVCVTGRLEWVPAWGQLQIEAEEVVPVGEGAIAAMVAAARARLGADGLLDRPRKPIPMLPSLIGVVCGRDAAVRADIESVVAARFPGYPIVFRETTVSGAGAAEHLIDAIASLETVADVIILARGGGDVTQLLPFSDEDLCRAVCRCAVPVVSAIGHDGDRPLVDDVADLRCGTPSLAAGAIVPSRGELSALLTRLWDRASSAASAHVGVGSTRLAGLDLSAASARAVERAGARLVGAASRLRLMHPARELERATVRLEGVAWRTPAPGRLASASARLGAVDSSAPIVARLGVAAARVAALAEQVEALSPVRVLERGYAVVRRTSDNTVVRRPDQASSGTHLELQVAAGTIEAVAS